MSKKRATKNYKKAAKQAKAHPALVTAAVIIVILLIAAAVLLYLFRPDLLHKYLGVGGHTYSQWQTLEEPTCGKEGKAVRVCTVCGIREEESLPATGNHDFDDDGICKLCGFDRDLTGNAADAAESLFSVHVIDLGKFAGDSIYIKAAGNDILIDAGSRAESAGLICTYLDNYVTDGKLEYVIATHADQDHIAAFAGSTSGNEPTGVLYRYKVGTLIRFDNVKTEKAPNASNPSTVYGKFCAAVEHAKEGGAKVYTAGQCYNESDGAKRQYVLDDGSLTMNILYNYYYYNVSDDENNHSVVTLFTHTTEGRTFNWLFTGDLEAKGEEYLVKYYSDPSNSKSEYDVLPDVDFYKAGHHGSGTSSSKELLDVIKPEIVAVSCCAGAPEYTKNNNNTFPYTDVFGRLLQYTDKIYCTGMAVDLPELGQNGDFAQKSWEYAPCNGNIVCYYKQSQSSAGSLKLWCGNSDGPVTQTEWYKNYRQGVTSVRAADILPPSDFLKRSSKHGYE